MTAAPAGAHKADAENTDAVVNAAAEQKKAAAQAKKDAKVATAAQPKPETVSTDAALAQAEVVSAAPEVPAPNTPLPDGEVEVTKDGATEITKAEKAPRTKKDPLKTLDDFSKLPVAVHIGQVAMSVEEYSGRAVLSLSLVGWVGEAPFKILAADVTELEDALTNLRKQLS